MYEDSLPCILPCKNNSTQEISDNMAKKVPWA
jgi:hypothetical protein